MKFEYGKHISPEAKSFINKFLVRDPKKRISIEDGLNHPWLQKYS